MINAKQIAASNAPKLKLDRQGGARLHAGEQSSLSLRQQSLRFLHLLGGPHLLELDLSRCAPGLELVLQECPQLQRIRLPEKPPGAVLHLDFGAVLAELEVLGALHSLDACWDQGSFAISAGEGEIYRHARIGGSLKFQARGHEIRIEHGPTVPAVLQLAGDASVRQLLVLQAERLTTLQLPARPLERVHVGHCPGLVTVQGDLVQRLRLEACPALKGVEVSGHAAALVAGTGAVDGLWVELPWSHLTIAETPARRLRAPSVGQLTLRDCADLMQAEVAEEAAITLSGRSKVALGSLARLRLDERAIAGLLARAAEQDELALRMLIHWFNHARQANEYLDALLALASAPADPVWLWQLRCRLHARCNLSQGALPTDAGCMDYALSHWEWRLPSDRYLEGWQADAQLWLRARARLPELERMLRHQPPLLAVAALARQLPDQSLSRQQESLLSRAIRHARRRGGNIADLPGADRLAMDLLASAIIAQRSLPLANALVQRLKGYAPAKHSLSVLGSLAAFGHAGARAALMAFAQSSDTAELRAQAMSLAFSPMRSEIFVEQEELAYG